MGRVAIKYALVVVFCALMFPIKAQAQAMPDLSQTTLTELQVLQGQAETLTLNLQGIQTAVDYASTIALFNGLYRGLQAWNEWQGGDDYIVTRQYIMERTELPTWLANYSGDVIFWELDYFGHTIELLTDSQGDILTDTERGKAVNLTIKNQMVQASEAFKAEIGNNRRNVPYPTAQAKGTYTTAFSSIPDPYVKGNEIHFYMNSGGTLNHYKITNAENKYFNLFKSGNWMGIAIWSEQFVNNGIIQLVNVDRNTTSNFNIVSSGYTTIDSQGNTRTNVGYCKAIGGNNLYSAIKLPCTVSTDPSALEFRIYNSVNCQGYVNGTFVMNGTDGKSVGAILVKTVNLAYVTNESNLQILPNEGISAQSLQEITDAITEIIPQTDPTTGIETFPLPENLPLPEALPLESTEPAPPIPPGIEDFPSSDPSQVPAQNPNVDPSTTPTEDSLPDSAEEIQPMEELQLVTGLQNRFPFSIPWDIYNAYRMLQAEKEPPEWTWDMVVNLPTGGVFTHTFTLSMEPVDSLVTLFRDLFLLAFILGLAIYSYNKFFGGGA